MNSNPRVEIANMIRNNDVESLLQKAGQIHGHYCPGLAMGVMAAVYAMNEINTLSDGMEDILAVTETNNCFSDGVQFVTGCSFGNNALIYHDLGKTAFTLTTRYEPGIRICSRHNSREEISNRFPDFQEYYQKVIAEQNHEPKFVEKYKKLALERAFGTLKIPFDKLFTVSKVEVDIPLYASIEESVICSSCNESVMKSRTRDKNGRIYCLSCLQYPFPTLDGNGIHNLNERNW